MAKESVLVLYNQPQLAPDDPHAASEHSVVETAEYVADTLVTSGFRTRTLALGRDPRTLVEMLQRRRPDAVFNLFEGYHDQAEAESYVAGVLEWAGMPYTGSPFQTLTLGRAKHTTKFLLKGAGLPTADFQVAHGLPAPRCTLEFPVIVKPAAQDASVGIDHGSVCTDQRAVNRRVAKVLRDFGPPVLIEEYIQGREFNVFLVELPTLRALTPIEIILPEAKNSVWSIYSHAGKWHQGTAEYEFTQTRVAADLARATRAKLAQVAMDVYRLLGCRDYARVDFRMKPNGTAYVLELNPNPDITPDAGLFTALASARLSHTEFLVRLVHQALRRGRHTSK